MSFLEVVIAVALGVTAGVVAAAVILTGFGVI
jgi:hypothetical protein